MKKLLFSLMITVALLAGNQSYAQKGVAINNTGADPDNSAILDVSSLTKGVLVPRMTEVQRTAIVTPVKGLLVYQNDGTEGFYYFDGTAWTSLASGTYTETDPLVKAINGVVKSNGTTISAAVAGTDYLTPAGNETMTNKTINGLTPIAAVTGFTIAGGTNSKTLTVPLDASVSGINTGDNATNTQYSGLEASKANLSGAAFTGDISATNLSGSSPNSKAILDLSSTTKGLLPPRMTYAQKIAITSPPAGLMVWCTNCGTYGELQVNNGTVWTNLIGGAATGSISGAPTIGTAIAGDGQASVSFTAPTSDGGSTITSYTATSSPGGKTETLAQAGDGTITVTGLTNGIPYTFTVTATNANGTSAASDPSNSVTPASVPGAPTGVSATAGNAQASVSFTAPASNGGSTIISYTATSSPDGITKTLTQEGSGTITVTGLTNGTAYTFTVTATNAIGTGAASAASSTVTPATVPGAPIIGTATAGNAQASVPFTAPASNGGSTITSYTATSSPGGITKTLTQAGSGTITVTGLTNGTAYTFTVTATNANGISGASTASNSVTPANVPDAPTIGTVVSGNAQASVPFTEPASNGGSTIISYTATSSPGGITGTLTQAGSGTITVTGLTNGTAYTFTVTAINAIGTGPASTASNPVTPFATTIVDVTSPTGKVWMDRNLGAAQVATSSTDAQAYGDLYQWGRATDGHEKRNSGITSTLSSSDTPGHGNFITINSGNYDWLSPQKSNLWQGASGTNNPCPSGYRLPTEAEWNAERLRWSFNTSEGAFGSPLKLPAAGYRSYSDGSLGNVGFYGCYWSSTVGDTYTRFLFFASGANISSYNRAFGSSVRCIKD